MFHIDTVLKIMPIYSIKAILKCIRKLQTDKERYILQILPLSAENLVSEDNGCIFELLHNTGKVMLYICNPPWRIKKLIYIAYSKTFFIHIVFNDIDIFLYIASYLISLNLYLYFIFK